MKAKKQITIPYVPKNERGQLYDSEILPLIKEDKKELKRLISERNNIIIGFVQYLKIGFPIETINSEFEYILYLNKNIKLLEDNILLNTIKNKK